MNKRKPGQLRIISGKWRHRIITMPKNSDIRPTPDRVRETVFNWLQQDIPGSTCLDLCCGSGSLGLEALSRGAAHVTFVDTDNSYLENINSHIKLFGDVKSVNFECISLLDIFDSTIAEPCDIIFVDPPYDKNLLQPFLNLLENSSCMTETTLVYCEKGISSKVQIPEKFKILKNKKYGIVEALLITRK